MSNVLILAGLAMTLVAPPAAPVSWSFAVQELPNGQVRVDISATIDKGWHVYATELPSDQGPLPTVISLAGSDRYYAVGGVSEPEPEKADDPNFGMVLHFHSNAVVFSQIVARKTGDAFTVKGNVEYMACNDEKCLPPVKVPFAIEVAALSK